MQLHQHGKSHPGKSQVLMMPIINLNPSDENCIYTTLLFIRKQATSMNVATPSINFDQPLWLKAYEITKSKQLDIVVQLRGFHTLMSFLGSIGAVMGRSELDKLLELIYASNSVTHIMSGKAVAKSLRAHFLVESALMGLLIEKAPKDEFNTFSLEKMYQDLVQRNLDLDDVESSDIVIRFTKVVEKFKLELSSASRTAKLWL